MHLRESGATAEVVDDADRAAFRRAQGVPDDAASCHTATIDDYAIEGHVPAAAIARLLNDRPTAVGLALSGMPADSPGMGGDPTTWASQQVVIITDGGSLSNFAF